MIKLNLAPTNEDEQRIKDYLEANVTQELAEKINNGIMLYLTI